MKIDAIGYNHRHDRSFCIDRPKGTESWLMLIIKTPAFFRSEGKDTRTPANSFIIYRPGSPQYYFPATNEYFDDWIHFYPDDEELSLLSELNIPLDRPTDIADTTDISSIVQNMCFENYSTNPYRQNTIDLYFRLMLYKISEKLRIMEHSPNKYETLYSERLSVIRKSIYRWPGRDYSIDDMAKELSLSRSRFQHLYTETFGVSVNKDVISSRLNKAAELLKTTDMSVKMVGVNVGYGNTSYFVKLFGSFYGMTPLQYRQSDEP